jgi:hypothetical protein
MELLVRALENIDMPQASVGGCGVTTLTVSGYLNLNGEDQLVQHVEDAVVADTFVDLLEESLPYVKFGFGLLHDALLYVRLTGCTTCEHLHASQRCSVNSAATDFAAGNLRHALRTAPCSACLERLTACATYSTVASLVSTITRTACMLVPP